MSCTVMSCPVMSCTVSVTVHDGCHSLPPAISPMSISGRTFV